MYANEKEKSVDTGPRDRGLAFHLLWRTGGQVSFACLLCQNTHVEGGGFVVIAFNLDTGDFHAVNMNMLPQCQ